MGGHKTDAPKAVDRLHLLKQLCKCHWLFQILSVGIHILAQKHHLHHAVCDETPDLSHDILGIPASLTAAHVRNDTVAAEIIAAKHNINAGLERVLPVGGKFFHDPVGPLPDVNYHLLLIHAFRNQFCQFENIMGSEYNVDKAVALLNLGHHGFLLHHTPAESDHHIGILLFDAV